MAVAESKRVLMTGSSLEGVGTGTTVLRAEKMHVEQKGRWQARTVYGRNSIFGHSTKGVVSRESPVADGRAQLSHAMAPGWCQPRRARNQCVPALRGSAHQGAP